MKYSIVYNEAMETQRTTAGISYTLRRNRNQRNLRIRIDSSGAVIVSCPFYATDTEIEDFVSRSASWIHSHVEKVADHSYTTSDFVPYLGEKKTLLVIEGKRTEPGITDHTTWMKHRDQMIRHMDGAYDYAKEKGMKVYGLYIVDDPGKYKFERYAGGPYRRGSSKSCWEESLPHRSQDERKYLKEHFLGYILWTDLLKIDKSICYIDSVADD